MIALVVQPGVEFDHHKVIDYRPGAGVARSARRSPPIRSSFSRPIRPTTRRPRTLQALVRDHFAILKVGPAATFALRETLWALDAIERELPGDGRRRGCAQAVAGGHARGPAALARLLSRRRRRSRSICSYSLSDRIRYYWPHPDVQRHATSLLASLRRRPPPLTLAEPVPAATIRSDPVGPAEASVDALLHDGIAAALRPTCERAEP